MENQVFFIFFCHIVNFFFVQLKQLISQRKTRGKPGEAWDHPAGRSRNISHRPIPSRTRECPFAIGHCAIATSCLINSHRKILINSGRITAFFGIIASAKKGGEAKLVQRDTIRARINKGVGGCRISSEMRHEKNSQVLRRVRSRSPTSLQTEYLPVHGYLPVLIGTTTKPLTVPEMDHGNAGVPAANIRVCVHLFS